MPVSYETAAAADALVAEVERLFALAIYHDPETQVYRGPIQLKAVPDLPPEDVWPPWAAYLRTGGYGGEIGIDSWKTSRREQAEDGEITWEQWLKQGQSFAYGLEQRVTSAGEISYWRTFANVFLASVKRDVEAVGDAASKVPGAVGDALEWLPWVVGGLAVIVGGFAIFEVAKTFRAAGSEARMTVQAAGSVARRRLKK